MAAVHAHDPRFFICCGIQGCSRSYQNFYSFKKHLYQKHRESLDVSVPVEVTNLSFSSVSEDGGSDVDFPLEIENEGRPYPLPKFQHMKQMALFLLKAREVRKVSQAKHLMAF